MDAQDTKTRGLTNKIKIDEESYNSLLDMLNASDEDAIVALTAINNLGGRKNLLQTLFLRKNANCRKDLWETHAKKVLKYHGGYTAMTLKYITYADLFNVIKTNKYTSKEDKEFDIVFYTKRLQNFIGRSLVGFEDVIDSIEINVKLKQHE
jgi:hypothetical protein